MNGEVAFSITGKPVAKGRGRVGQVNGRPMVFTPSNTRKWERDARMVARQEMAGRAPLDGPLSLTVRMAFAVPQSWPQWKREAALEGRVAHTTKPDADNVLKAVKDALNGIVWLDDAQVCVTTVRKEYGEIPLVGVRVTPTGQMASQSKKKPAAAAA